MGLPRLIGKALNTRIIYQYRPDSMAMLVLWIPVFTGKTIPGVSGQPHKVLYEVNVLRKSGQVWEKKHESSLYLYYVVPAYAVLYNRLFPHTRINKRKGA
jgi:hypothetical protein